MNLFCLIKRKHSITKVFKRDFKTLHSFEALNACERAYPTLPPY